MVRRQPSSAEAPVLGVRFILPETSKNAELQHKLTAFIEETRCRSSVHLTLVATYALARNEYSGQVQSVVTMDDLFCANSR